MTLTMCITPLQVINGTIVLSFAGKSKGSNKY